MPASESLLSEEGDEGLVPLVGVADVATVRGAGDDMKFTTQ